MIGEFPLLPPPAVGGSGVAQDRIASTGEVDETPAAEIPTKSEGGEEEEDDVESVLDVRFISLFSIFLAS